MTQISYFKYDLSYSGELDLSYAEFDSLVTWNIRKPVQNKLIVVSISIYFSSISFISSHIKQTNETSN